MKYPTDAMTLKVSNPLPPRGNARARSRAPGAGYGLTGLRERAALAGGTLTAAPEDGRWTVRLQAARAAERAGQDSPACGTIGA